MPWNETEPMNERVKFIARYLANDEPLTVLCEESGISRKTGYKWIERYEAGAAISSALGCLGGRRADCDGPAPPPTLGPAESAGDSPSSRAHPHVARCQYGRGHSASARLGASTSAPALQ